MAAGLQDLREQLELARAELAQLRSTNAANTNGGTYPIPELLAANEQLVVAALRSETRFRAYFDVSPEYLYLLRLSTEDRFVFEDADCVYASFAFRDSIQCANPRARTYAPKAFVVGPSVD